MVCALRNILPLSADRQRLLTLRFDPLPAIRPQRNTQRYLFPRSHARALDQLNHSRNSLIGVARLIADNGCLVLPDTGIKLGINRQAGLDVLDVREDLGPEITRLNDEHFDTGSKQGQFFGEAFNGTWIRVVMGAQGPPWMSASSPMRIIIEKDR